MTPSNDQMRIAQSQLPDLAALGEPYELSKTSKNGTPRAVDAEAYSYGGKGTSEPRTVLAFSADSALALSKHGHTHFVVHVYGEDGALVIIEPAEPKHGYKLSFHGKGTKRAVLNCSFCPRLNVPQINRRRYRATFDCYGPGTALLHVVK